MNPLVYTLLSVTETTFLEIEGDAPYFNHSIRVADGELSQIFEITCFVRFNNKDRADLALSSKFKYDVPYGQDAIDLEAISNQLAHRSFYLQKQQLEKSPYVISREIPDVDDMPLYGE